MKTIIAATDFSSCAFNAAQYAIDMATSLDAEVILFHVYNIPFQVNEIPVYIDEEDIRRTADISIHDIRAQLLANADCKIPVATELRLGVFFDELENFCKEVHPYAVIMGSQGSTAAERMLFGGHTVHAMKHLEWPVITVPQDVHYKGAHKIAIACDLKKDINTLPIDAITKVVRDLHASVTIVNMGQRYDFDPEIVHHSTQLREVLKDLAPTYKFLAGSNYDNELIDFAEENKIDMLIVAPKRHSLIDRLIHRSHTKKLVLHSHVPVMALHKQ